MKQVKNALEIPKLYYGLHMCPGVAEYPEEEGSPRYYVGPDACRKMDPTAQGKPVYVHHVEKVDLEKLEEQMDGIWVRSFFNEADGMHWAEFLVITEEAHQAVRNGWKLSDSYVPTQKGPAGSWHAVEYQVEVMDGEYTHLAITPTPRYQESIILTPEEFKEYNRKLLEERKALQNSAGGGKKMKLSFFKRDAVKNSQDFEGLDVTLPRTKKTVSVEKVLNELDERMEKEGKGEQMANMDHMIEFPDKSKMNVGELVEKFTSLQKENAALKANYDELAKELHPTEEPPAEPSNEDPDKDKDKDKDKDENQNQEDKDKEKDEKEKENKNAQEKHEKAVAAAKALKNAHHKGFPASPGEDGSTEPRVIELDQVGLGRSRYGSGS